MRLRWAVVRSRRACTARYWRPLAAVVAVCLFAATAQGQGTVSGTGASITVSPTTVMVGEPFTVRLHLRGPAGITAHFPSVPDSGGTVEATDPRAIEDSSTATTFDQTAVYRFIAWEPGRRAIPLGGFSWVMAGSPVVHSERSEAMIEVASALPADTALQQAKGARDTIAPPIAWWRVLLAAVALLTIVGLIWWARRRRTALAATPDAYADAQAGFAAVDELALTDAGEPGRAMLAYAEVMRAYLTRRFPAAGDGLTSREYVRVLEANDLPILPDEVRSVLDAADTVKFAGEALDAERVRLHAAAARGVVRDVQMAYQARLAALDRGKGPKGRRRTP